MSNLETAKDLGQGIYTKEEIIEINTQYHIMGHPSNTGGSGLANAFGVKDSINLVWSSDRIIVPVSGVYSISFNTISDNSSIRVDTDICVNGVKLVEQLSEDNTKGYHQKSVTISKYLSIGDYIQFNNDDWYSATNLDTSWRTASVTLL